MPYSNRADHRAASLRRVKARRDEWIASRGGACESCGSLERLEVDHIDRTQKVYYPRDIWNRRAEVRLPELAKCQVLCYNCHLAKTVAENTTALHGSHRRYVSGCRCDKCRAGHAAEARKYRASKAE